MNWCCFFTFCSRRWEENVGENNQGYDDRDGNQNSVAGAEEIELVNIGLIVIFTLSNIIVVPFDMLQQYIRLVWSSHRSVSNTI